MRKWQMTKNRKIKDLYNLLSLICFYSSIAIKDNRLNNRIKKQNKEIKDLYFTVFNLLFTALLKQ